MVRENTQHACFRELIQRLWETGSRQWTEIAIGDRKKLQGTIARAINQSIASSADVLGQRLWSSKNNLDNALVPLIKEEDKLWLLHADWDFTLPQSASLEVSICLVTNIEEEVPKFIGFRYEQPHDFGPDQGGDKHKYWHAQPIKRLGKTKMEVPSAEKWMPDDVPAIPLAAWSCVSLLANAVVSVLGADINVRKRLLEAARAAQLDQKEVLGVLNSMAA